jgi:hypothetical protein
MARIAFPFYLWQKILFSFQKEWMFEKLILTALYFRFMKIVHIKLPNKR